MKLFKWTENLKPAFPKFIENLFGNKIKDNAEKGEQVGSVPAVNVEQAKNNNYQIQVAIPGLHKNDVKVEVLNNVLTIYSEKQYSDEEKGKNYIRQEFAYASFCRSFAIPENSKTDAIEAKLENGMLTISIPQDEIELQNVKKIKVE